MSKDNNSTPEWYSRACRDVVVKKSTPDTVKTAITGSGVVAHAVFAKAGLLWPNGTVRILLPLLKNGTYHFLL